MGHCGRQFQVLVLSISMWKLIVGISLFLFWGCDPAGDRLEHSRISTDGGFPRSARDVLGDELRLQQAPETLASQSLVSDHYLFAVALPESIVVTSSVAHDSSYSYIADQIKNMDVAIASDLEAVLRRRPDLTLVAQTALAEYVEITRSAGLPVFRMQTVNENFDQIADGLETTGFLTGKDEQARDEIHRLGTAIDAAKKRKPAVQADLRILAFYNFAHTYGKGSLFDHIVTELGAINIAAEQGIGPYGTISSEHVAAWNPDWIITAGSIGSLQDMKTRMLADVGVSVTTAGRKKQVLVVENRLILSMSQHAVNLLEALSQAIYPEEI